MKKNILCISLIMLFAAGFLMSGCSSKKDSTDEKSDEQTVSDEKTEKEQDPDALLNTIGVEQTGEHVYKIKLKNETGKDIIGFSIKETSQEEFPENLLEEDDVFAADEERILYYDATEAIEAAQSVEPADENTPALDPAYDISLTFKEEEEDTVLVLHYFPFDDMESGSIQLEDEVAFVSYHSTVTDQDISTKEAELKIKADEAEAAQQSTAQTAPANNSQTTQQPSQSTGQSSTYTPAPAVEQPATEQPAVEQPAVEQPATEQPAVEQPSGNVDSGCIGNEGLVY